MSFEDMYNKNMQDYMQFQKNLMESMTKFREQFDVQKSMDEVNSFQEKMTKGIKLLMELKDEDVASDQLEKVEVLKIGKMKLYHYKPTVPPSQVSKVPTLIAYALVNRQYMMDILSSKAF